VPECRAEIAHTGDLLLLCCDGIVEQLSNEQVVTFVHSKMNGIRTEGEQEAKDGRPAQGNVRDADGEIDPGLVMKELLKFSLNAGSKDNHSAMLIILGANGMNFKQPDEFQAGPYHPYADDKTFSKAYLSDAEKHGFRGEVLMEMARKAEEALGPELFQPRHHDDSASMNLSQLLASAFGGAQDPQSVQEQIMALSSLLSVSPQGGPNDDDDGDDFPAAELVEAE